MRKLLAVALMVVLMWRVMQNLACAVDVALALGAGMIAGALIFGELHT